MEVIDEGTLDVFRKAGYCDVCGCYTCRLQPHHIVRKNMGGHGNIDVRVNILGVDVECHDRIHLGKISKERQLELVAQREGVSVDAIKEALRAIRALPKNSPPEVWQALLPRRTT